MSARPHSRPHHRPVHANAVHMALRRCQTIAREDVAKQHRIMLTARHEFARGVNCALHWRSLADVANLAETFAHMGIGSGPDAERVVTLAQETLFHVMQRQRERTSWTLHAAELEALDWLIALHLKQLSCCDMGEFERALLSTHQRVAQARAGNAPAGAIVIEGEIT